MLRAVGERQLAEVGVLRDDDVVILTGVLPDLPIGRCVEAQGSHVLTSGEHLLQGADQPSREVLVEQQLHAVARRRSRSAANSMAARTCSDVSSGKSATISAVVIPDARYSRTS